MISPFSNITIPAFGVTHLKLNGNRMENTWPVKRRGV